jgi:hypothetical protein
LRPNDSNLTKNTKTVNAPSAEASILEDHGEILTCGKLFEGATGAVCQIQHTVFVVDFVQCLEGVAFSNGVVDTTVDTKTLESTKRVNGSVGGHDDCCRAKFIPIADEWRGAHDCFKFRHGAEARWGPLSCSR